MASFQAGQILRFTYHSHTGASPDEIQDPFKEVLVLHPSWRGKMHGIDLKRLTPAEREVLEAVFEPPTGKPHRISLVNDVRRRMNPIEEVKNPVSFYSKFVKIFLKNKDAYRTYYPLRMRGVTVAKRTSVTGQVTNPKPLFHGVRSSEKEERAQEKPSRLDLIKQRHQQSQKGGAQPPAPPPADRARLIKQRAEIQRAKKPPRPR